MDLQKQQQIWPIETGITDITSDNWSGLAVPAIEDIVEVWKGTHTKLKDTHQLRMFNERLAREWAIETGVIEDVFHIDKGVTLNLIEQGISAALFEYGSTNRPVEYVIDILRDHVDALDWVFTQFVTQKQPLTVPAIKELHALLTQHQVHVVAMNMQGAPIRTELVRGDGKKHPNNALRDGILYCYSPPLRVQDEMETLVSLHSQHDAAGMPPDISSAWLHHRFTQIHPFQDGNGRVARSLASMVFLRAGLFPVVITRDMRQRYINALEAADAGNLRALVEVFAAAQQERFDRALNISDDLASAPLKSAELAIQALKAKWEARGEKVANDQKRVFELSKRLEKTAARQLSDICEALAPIDAYVSSSKVGETDHFYRIQVIEAAKGLGYFASLAVYHAWVRLVIPGPGDGNPQGQLLLSFHARGSEFSGVMVCTPVFELVEPATGSQTQEPAQRTQIPITDRPFEFYYTERDNSEVEARFVQWLDELIALAVSQYQRNL